jgi:hypothetical protein
MVCSKHISGGKRLRWREIKNHTLHCSISIRGQQAAEPFSLQFARALFIIHPGEFPFHIQGKTAWASNT